MKNISLILNVLLLLLVGNLYWKSYKTSPVATINTSLLSVKDTVNGKLLPGSTIVYVNSDSILEKFEFFKSQKRILEKKTIDIDTNLKAKGRKLQEQIMALQEKAQKGNTPPAQLQAEEQNLTMQQQTLMAEQDQKTKQISEEGEKLNEQLQKRVKAAIKKLKEKTKFDYAVSYSSSVSAFLLVDETKNITSDVILELNKK
jgi:outer membrane protein